MNLRELLEPDVILLHNLT